MTNVEMGIVSSIEGSKARIIVPTRNDYVTPALNIPDWFRFPEHPVELNVGDSVLFVELTDFSGAILLKL